MVISCGQYVVADMVCGRCGTDPLYCTAFILILHHTGVSKSEYRQFLNGITAQICYLVPLQIGCR